MIGTAWAEITDATFSVTREAVALKSSPVITFGYIFQLFFSLLVIIGLIYFAGRFVLPRFKVGGMTGMIEVLDRHVLEPQVTSYILRTKGKEYFVVVTGKNVVVLDQFKEEKSKA